MVLQEPWSSAPWRVDTGHRDSCRGEEPAPWCCRRESGRGAGVASPGGCSRKENLLRKGGENNVGAEAAFSKAALA